MRMSRSFWLLARVGCWWSHSPDWARTVSSGGSARMLATYATGSRIKTIRGDLDAAASRLAEGAKSRDSLNLPWLAARVTNEQFRLGRLRPILSENRDMWKALENPLAADRTGSLRCGTETDLNEALQRSEALVKRIEQEIRPRAPLRARVLHASALQLACGDRASLPAVEPLVTMCEKQGLVRTLIDESDCIGHLLVDLQHQSESLVAASY